LKENQFFDLLTPPFDIQKHCLYVAITGSRAYGIDTPTSDYDIRGVLYLPEEFIFGSKTCEQVENQTKDIAYYSPKKFFNLALKNNVHAMELLWMPERTVKFTHPLFQQVLDARNLFLSTRIAYTCGGYAFQQVKLSFLKKANNSGRQHLITTHGFDTKMLSHAFRIFRMGREALVTGNLEVYRTDREFLLDIKRGRYTLEELVIMGKDENGKEDIVGGLLFEEKTLFNEAVKKTKLPSHPDFNLIDKLLVKLQKETLDIK
jgi:hypothetical protein